MGDENHQSSRPGWWTNTTRGERRHAHLGRMREALDDIREERNELRETVKELEKLEELKE